MKIILLICFAMLSLSASAQAEDFIVLKKKTKNIQTFFSGKKIQFQYHDGRKVFGLIKKIKNDSLIIEQWNIYAIPTPLGISIADTVKFKDEGFAVNKIVSIPNPKSKSAYALPGALLMIGAGGYSALHVINNLTQSGGKIEGDNLLSAAGFFGLGALLTWAKPKSVLKLGKKYNLHYINISTINKPG